MSGRAVVRLPWSDLTSVGYFGFFLRLLYSFYKPPAGGAGGSEQSDRARPELKRGTWTGRRERGAGGGDEKFLLLGCFAWLLCRLDSIVLLVCVLHPDFLSDSLFWKSYCGTTAPHFSQSDSQLKL